MNRAAQLTVIVQFTDGERGRLDRSRRRPADGTASARTETLEREWNLLCRRFGATPNRATGTVALPFSSVAKRLKF